MTAGAREALNDMLAQGPILGPGALGTELARRGVPTPMPLWSAAALDTHPDLVRDIHAGHADAGSRIIVANTFRADRVTLAPLGRARETRAMNKLAVQLAREGVARARPAHPVLVVGSVAPVADCYEPTARPPTQTLRLEHGVRIGHLVAAGAAAAWIETMNTIEEACIALEAAAAGNLPAAVSFCVRDDGALLSGESFRAAASAVAGFAPLALGVNCAAPAACLRTLRSLDGAATPPLMMAPNGRGAPHPTKGWHRSLFGGASDRALASAAAEGLALGVQILGACCGTTTDTLRRLGTCLPDRR